MVHRIRFIFAAAFIALLLIGVLFLVSRPDRQTDIASGEPDLSDSMTDSGSGESNAAAGIESQHGPPWFLNITSETGIDFVHDSGTSEEKPFPAANGSGLGTVDFDRDGFPDLYFLTGTDFPVDTSRTSPRNRLYRNRDGRRFDDVTEQSGVGWTGYSAGLAVGDFNNDGFPDLYVNCYGANQLFQNLGDGTFAALPIESGICDERWGTSTAFLDFNNDGLSDLYVCNYAKWSLETNTFCGNREKGVRLFCSPRSVEADSDALYQNLGDGSFREVTAEVGLNGAAGRAQGIVAADLNNDGRIDIYVGNDLHANSLYFNRDDGVFEDVGEITGAAYDYVGNMQAGMGVDAADANLDGLFDLFVTNFEDEHNAYYENRDGAVFEEVSHSRRLATASLPWVGWGTSFSDFDLDGMPDLVVTNGHVDDNRRLLGQDARYDAPALVWKNQGGRFEFLGPAAGEYFKTEVCGRGLCTVDLDRDGDTDLVIGHQDAPPAILKNVCLETTDNLSSVRIRLIGTVSNRDAVGARLTVVVDGEDRTRHLQIKGGGSYLSASESTQIVGVSERQTISLRINWPAGTESSFDGLQAGQSYTIVESSEVSPSGLMVTP